MDLLLARNPEPDSSLPLLLRVPLGDGLVFRTKGTWPRTSALYCHPVPRSEWPAEPDLVEQIPLRSCVRRGGAVDLVADRTRESRSQIVYTRARGREMVFWQTPKTRKQARPDVRLPTARASALTGLTILVDAHERYAYRFAHQQVTVEKRTLRCGDYAVEVGAEVAAAVERKSLTDLLSSMTSGRLRFALAELAGLPRAAVVVEDRYSQVFTSEHVRASVAADGLAELQVRYPNVPIVFCETRSLAEEWTYRYLAAAVAWSTEDGAALDRVESVDHGSVDAASVAAPAVSPPGPGSVEQVVGPAPTTREIRSWAVEHGLPVSDRGRLRPEVLRAWREAHPSG